MRTRLNVRSGASPVHRETPRARLARYGGSPQAAMLRGASDACSIFVGNLPPDAALDDGAAIVPLRLVEGAISIQSLEGFAPTIREQIRTMNPK